MGHLTASVHFMVTRASCYRIAVPYPLRDIELAPRTTLGVGGCARFFWEVESEGELCAAVRWAKREGVPLKDEGAETGKKASHDEIFVIQDARCKMQIAGVFLPLAF